MGRTIVLKVLFLVTKDSGPHKQEHRSGTLLNSPSA
jgi:hypothetical protein